jgi:hypothetical protein
MIRFTPKHLSSLAKRVAKRGLLVPSERGDTLEIQDALLFMQNPRDRIVTERWRKMNIGFAIVDALSHIVGDNSLNPLTQFVPSFSQYSSNGETIDGAYGTRINRGNQLNNCIKSLIKTPETRRAVISIYCGPDDLNGAGGVNTPCTLNFHFLVRNGKLNMKVMMRSNDIVLGLTNDIFTFTMLHEYVSIKTGIPLGSYSHFASSLHLYTSDVDKYSMKWEENGWANSLLMDDMPKDFDAFKMFWSVKALNEMSLKDCILKNFDLKPGYEEDLFFTSAFIQKRNEKDAEALFGMIKNKALKRVASYWLKEHA